ncbi:MAG: 2-dehydro-3-deoxyglucarate aldolase [Alphaproteobacteria bacterium]|nr:MAG: 2-dehydro-3-deoxyglucarate aldolase [Alphaproteobacteria bacterium]
MRTNRLKKKLLEGKPAVGCSVMIPSPELVEMLAAIGFDWVLIDCEHGAMSMETVENMVRAAEAFGITPIGRPRRNDPSDIMMLMNRGVMGVQVPYVDTAEQAEAAVSAVKFGPGTARGLAIGTRPHGYGFIGSQEAFTRLSNRETMVIVQIETGEAIANIDEIVQVPDIDVFFVGPSDLAQSMGCIGNPQEPRVVKAIATATATIRKTGKIAGMPCGMENVTTVVNSGVRYLHAHLPWIIGYGGKTFLNKVNACDNSRKALI